MSVFRFEPLRYLPRNYVRGADFLRFALGLDAGPPERHGGLDIRFPRFTTRTGHFVAAGAEDRPTDTPAILSLPSAGGAPRTLIYREAAAEAETSTHDPETVFHGRATVDGRTAHLRDVPPDALIDATVYLVKTLHQTSVTNDGKWIFTRYRTGDVDAMRRRATATAPLAITVTIESLRADTTSASRLHVDGADLGEVFFFRLAAPPPGPG